MCMTVGGDLQIAQAVALGAGDLLLDVVWERYANCCDNSEWIGVASRWPQRRLNSHPTMLSSLQETTKNNYLSRCR